MQDYIFQAIQNFVGMESGLTVSLKNIYEKVDNIDNTGAKK